MDRSAFATQTRSFDLAVPLCHAKRWPHHHRSPLCTEGRGPRQPSGGKGLSAAPHLAKGLVWEQLLVLQLQELEPSRDGPGLLCGRQAQGPS